MHTPRPAPEALTVDPTPAGGAGISSGETLVEGPETPSPPTTPWTSPEGPAKAFPGAPVRGWDRYEFVDFLGQGGMGRVYKAYDRRLKRPVALKFILQDNPELARRFLQEAQAQARVEHEHVCKVYEVGEVQGQLYIAMQYIEGRTLKDAAAEMNLEQKLRAIQQVAQGLHAAHRIGLIHRDIKPSNVMVARIDEGRWAPYVMDFGLARDVQAHGETVTGAVLGTPAYMAPEQALGQLERLDRRTDVYSLGATMYEMLTGRVPFEAPSATALLLKVINEEPLASRKINPGIPVDLDTIVMKCLEKEIHRRYDSARALADDLQRYLDGEPVEARAATWGYKLYKRAKKNKAVFAVSTLALVAVMVLGGYGIRSRWLARSEAILAQRFGLEIKEIEAIMRFAHMAPLHNIRNEMDLLKRRMMAIEEQMERVGDAGYGPGHYALGRGYLALGKYESAREHLEKAWAAGFQDDSVAMALGRTLGALYLKQLEQIERITDRDARGAKRLEIEKAFRDPAIEHLRRVRDVGTESPDYVKGLVAFYEKQYEPALRRARAAREAAVWLYEASILEGDVHRAMGSEKQDRGEYEAARAEYDLAEAAYQLAASVGESDPDTYQQLCALHVTTMRLLLYEIGGDPTPYFERVTSAVNRMLQADPKSAEAHGAMAEAHWLHGEYLMMHGAGAQPALDEFDRAVEAASRSLALDSQNDKPYLDMGVAYGLRGVIEKETGVDPRETLNRAIDSFTKAAAIDAMNPDAYKRMGIAYLDIGEFEMRRGMDPRKSFQAGIACYRKAVEINPRFVSGFNNMGIIYFDLAMYEMDSGMDPSDSFSRSIDAYKKALEINPNHAYSLGNLGSVCGLMARWELETGRDPTKTAADAIHALDQALKVHSDVYLPLLNLAHTRMVLAQFDVCHGRDPSGVLRQARESLQRVFDDFGEELGCMHLTMRAALIEARYAIDQNRSPLGGLAPTAPILEKAIAIDPTSSETHTLAGELHLLKVQWAISLDRPAERELVEAERAFGEAIRYNDRNTDALAGLAETYRWRAESSTARADKATHALQRGLEVAERAIAVNPACARAHAVRGFLYLLRARSAATPGAKAEAATQAREALERAIELNSNLRRELQPYLEQVARAGTSGH
ncbi:MAG: protein kinase [Acidobacteriota bacterium]